MKKAILLLIGAIGLIGIIIYISTNNNEGTTLGEVLENNNVSEIFIRNENNEETVTLTSEEQIDQILEATSNMRISRTNEPPNQIFYFLTIKSEDYHEYTILIGETKIDVWDNEEDENSGIYEIQGDNNLLEIINNENLEWVAP